MGKCDKIFFNIKIKHFSVILEQNMPWILIA